MIGFGRNALRGAGVLAMLAASPAAAQVAPASGGSAPATVAPTDTVGPRELHNFSLGIKPLLQATPPDLISPRSRGIAPPPPRVVTTPSRAEPQPSTVAQGTANEPTAPTPTRPTTAPSSTSSKPSSSQTVALPPADPLLGPATVANETELPSVMDTSPATSGSVSTSDPTSLPLAWLAAFLVAVIAGFAFFFRDRLRGSGRYGRVPAMAGGATFAPDPAPPEAIRPAPVRPEPPRPAPLSRAAPSSPILPRVTAPAGGITVRRPDPFATPNPAPPPPPPARPTGIVSSRLRPWLDIRFDPSRAVIDEGRASVQFNITVTNSGSAPARSVLVEGVMINAGAEQDIELSQFFEAPIGAGERIDSIPPMGSVELKSAVSLPLDQVRTYDVNGRKLFVPVIAFNAIYEWSGGTGQSSASFLLGRSGSGEADGDGSSRMAPLRLDLGPRLFRDLDARRHTLGVRR